MGNIFVIILCIVFLYFFFLYLTDEWACKNKKKQPPVPRYPRAFIEKHKAERRTLNANTNTSKIR